MPSRSRKCCACECCRTSVPRKAIRFLGFESSARGELRTDFVPSEATSPDAINWRRSMWFSGEEQPENECMPVRLTWSCYPAPHHPEACGGQFHSFDRS